MTYKISLLWNFEISEVFVNILTADENYSFGDCENLQLPIQMQLSQSKKLFLNFLFCLWNLHQIWNISEKRMIVIANIFRKLRTVKGLFKPLSRKRCFRTSFDSQRVNGCQTVVKWTWEHFYHIFWWLWGEMI